MPADYYGGDDEGAMDKPVMGGPDKEKPDEEEEETTTALLPKSILGGKEFQPGEEVVLKVVHLYDDQVEVAYAKGKGSEESESEMDRASGKMTALATEGEE